jgi:hypothetical protein
MKTIVAFVLILVAVPAFSISFDLNTGSGNMTAGEIPCPGPVGFVLSQTDWYTVTVQYTNGLGQVVNQQQRRQAHRKVSVPSRVTASGIDFTGYNFNGPAVFPNGSGNNFGGRGSITRLGVPPQIGDKLPPLDLEGKPLFAGLGIVTAVTFVSTDSQLNCLSGVYGDFKIW